MGKATPGLCCEIMNFLLGEKIHFRTTLSDYPLAAYLNIVMLNGKAKIIHVQ
jgi:hypothetical protein